MKYLFSIFLLLSFELSALSARPSLEEISKEVNKLLPENYDSITRLMKTTVDFGNFNYHFIVNATQAEFDKAMPKVKTQVMSTVCSKRTERSILKDSNIVYKYEDVKGLTLGSFMIRPEHCQRERK